MAGDEKLEVFGTAFVAFVSFCDSFDALSCRFGGDRRLEAADAIADCIPPERQARDLVNTIIKKTMMVKVKVLLQQWERNISS